MYCIGLTGKIGSGKSTVLRYFASLGADIISADDINREITAPKQPILKTIEQHFQTPLITPEGALDRPRLRQLIFNDAKQRLWLEQLLHPLIREEIFQRVQHSQGPYCVIEIPLLLKREDYPYLNRILLIDASESLQIERIMARDHCTYDAALTIINCQKQRPIEENIADDRIENNGDIAQLYQQVRDYHCYYVERNTN